MTQMRLTTRGSLLVALALVAVACGGLETSTTDVTDTSLAPKASVQDELSNDQTDDPESPVGDANLVLEWTESDLSGEIYVDQLMTTNEGFVAYRYYEDPQAWRSEDGIKWTQTDLDLGTAVELGEITAGGPGYVALGSTSDVDAALSLSEDGFTWETRAIDIEIPPGDFEGFHQVISVDGGLMLEGSFVERYADDGEGEFHGHSLLLALSPDGLSWDVLPENETLFGPGAQVSDITSTSRGVVATGYVEAAETVSGGPPMVEPGRNRPPISSKNRASSSRSS
jgi:hypothetical protein